MNPQRAYFLHPHCAYPNDAARATVWWALLQEDWMSTDEMLAVFKKAKVEAQKDGTQ